MKIALTSSCFVALFAGAAFAQTPEAVSPEKEAVLALDRAYETAFAKGDAGALAAFFSEDAEQTTEDGTQLRGKVEIELAIKTGLESNKGAKLEISADSVRLLAPEVAVEKGVTTFTAKDGDTTSSAYTAIYVKKDGGWKISQLTETALPPTTPRERLAELDWLVGTWSEKDGDANITSSIEWARGGNFLSRSLKVEKTGETELEGWQIIGWDAAREEIRSWTFDSEGGVSEGRWSRGGDSWLIRESGTLPDGSRTTAEQTLSRKSGDVFTWEASNRTLDGEPQPAIDRIEINRVKEN